MNDKRRALGRGLGALIPTEPLGEQRPVDVFFREHSELMPRVEFSFEADGDAAHVPESPRRQDSEGPDPAAWDAGLRPVPGAQYAEIPVSAIRPNPRQPRTTFDPDELAELAGSIRQIGLLQPVVVRQLAPDAGMPPDGEPTEGATAEVPAEAAPAARYELVMGERRWRAAQQAGLDVVPAIVKQTRDDAMLRDALIENLHRSALNPLEEAAAYQQLLDDFGCTQEELSTRIGRSRPQVSNTLRLLRLPVLVQRRVAAGVLSAGHARALLSLDDAAAMERLAQRVVAEGLSVRSVEEIVAVGAQPASGALRRQGSAVRQLDDVAARLSDRLDTRVQVALGRRKGRVTIEFAGQEDLDRILDLLGIPSIMGEALTAPQST